MKNGEMNEWTNAKTNEWINGINDRSIHEHDDK